MVLELLKRFSLVFIVLFLSGCIASVDKHRSIPNWVEDPSLGQNDGAVATCYINSKKYKSSTVKKIILMKLKAINAENENIVVESKYSKKDFDVKKMTQQSSNKSYSNNYKILNKYKKDDQYCMRVIFKK